MLQNNGILGEAVIEDIKNAAEVFSNSENQEHFNSAVISAFTLGILAMDDDYHYGQSQMTPEQFQKLSKRHVISVYLQELNKLLNVNKAEKEKTENANSN